MKQSQASRKPRSHPVDQNPRKALPAGSLAAAFFDAGRIIERVFDGANLTQVWLSIQDDGEWTPAHRGAVRDLAWNALRQYGRGDFILGRLLHKPLPDKVRAVLLAALSRLEARPQQSHVIVDQAVDAVAVSAPGLRGVANGVLRNRIRQMQEIDRAIELDPVARWCHPLWWIKRVQGDHPDTWQQIMLYGNTHPPMSLRVNRRRSDRDSMMAKLEQHGMAAAHAGEDGIHLERPVPVSEVPGYAEGLISVQDLGAQYAAALLDPQDGERVLDACAAPGGKTAHIAERADVDLLALDVDADRLQTVGESLRRLGLDARMCIADAGRPEQWWDGRPFDRILADVPCSASGVVRRHPDIKWHRQPEDITGFAATQRTLLDALWQTLAPGGTMLYATCSTFDEENGAQIQAFCARHGNVERQPLHGREELQLLPDAGHDGFYYAALRKRG